MLFTKVKKTGALWTLSKKQDYINILKLKAPKYAILTSICLHPTAKKFTYKWSIVTLSFFVKMGVPRYQIMTQQGNFGILSKKGNSNLK